MTAPYPETPASLHPDLMLLEASIDEIAAQTLNATPATQMAVRDASLADGSAGVIIWLVELYIHRQDGQVLARLRRELDQIFECVESQPFSFGLYSGLAGISWAINYAIERIGHSELGIDPGCTSDVDNALLSAVEHAPEWEYDLVNGLVGLGAWALELGDRDLGRRVFLAVLRRLNSMREMRHNGATWWTAPKYVPPHMRTTYPSGFYNLGLAHGVPGVISMIARGSLFGFTNDSDIATVRMAVDWVLSCQISGGKLRFPYYEGNKSSRLAWCYGDLGVAVALVQAANCLNDKTLMVDAVEIARDALDVWGTESSIVDGMICHGALGVSHIADEFKKMTGDRRFAVSSDKWLHLAARAPEGANENLLFPTYMGKVRGYQQCPGYLMGIAGAGLVLLSLKGDELGHWNHPLMTSLTE